ncbi:MAG: hypothetical protein CL449_03510 [Acidimicrobiaceae bacterium]|jgi:uncharacterized membrane protein|nr:hypothetical protein [Acidimicrobiaceae bacterium]|tara:strand:+ start:276 stop:650 length:375 start_codon:yes stop_codon:yes gene_type:complete
MNLAKNIVGCLLGLPFVWIGIQHFVNPKAFNEIVPRYLGAPSFWTYASGVLEILLGLGIMIPVTRTISARLLVVLVLAMSLANLNMYLNDIPFNGNLLSATGHAIRLIIQILLLVALLWLGAIF